MTEAQRSPSPPVATFVKRTKGRARASGGLRTRSEDDSTPNVALAAAPADGETGAEDEANISVVVRSSGLGGDKAIKKKVKKQKPAAALSFGDDEGGEDTFQVKRSSLAKASSEARKAQLAVPDTLDQAFIDAQPDASGSSYSASALAKLKAATPSLGRRPTYDEPGAAYMDLDDPMESHQDDSLVRQKYGDDFGHDEIPSEALIAAAKEKRARAAASNGLGAGSSLSEDYLSLGAAGKKPSRALASLAGNTGLYDGPHPESRLQREDDDLGSGEDEHADYTGAAERMPLGKKAEKEAARRKRRDMAEAIGETVDVDMNGGHDTKGLVGLGEEEDEDEREWERAQLSRMDMPGQRQRQDGREKSPYRPAPIPHTAPLPSIASASARLRIRLAQLESSAEAHSKVVTDSVRGLAQLNEDEKDNKAAVSETGEKEAWFRELEEFTISVATFLDEKMPALEGAERDFVSLLSERTLLCETARSKDAEDELSMFFGVPAQSLLPPRNKLPADSDAEGSVNGQGASRSIEAPEQDGDARSEVRHRRRQSAESRIAALRHGSSNSSEIPLEYDLEEADAAAFVVARRSLSQRVSAILSDVAAPQFRDPAVRLPDGSLHPASLVARFARWRRRYAEDYAGAWGGLALAGVWEFWAREELVEWDCLRSCFPLPAHLRSNAPEYSSLPTGPSGLDKFRWHGDLMLYAERQLEPKGEASSASSAMDEQPVGGDDEAVGSLVSNVVVPRLCAIADEGAYDPWSRRDTVAAIELAEQVTYVLDKQSWRFQSLVTAYLSVFRTRIAHLVTVLSSPPTIPAPGFDPASIPARASFVWRLLGLLRNLCSWSRHISSADRPSYVSALDDLVGKCLWPFMPAVAAADKPTANAMAEQILSVTANSELAADVKSRLEAVRQ